MPTLDHVVPRLRGGRTRVENLHLACARCNSLKGARSVVDFLQSSELEQRRNAIRRELAPPKRWFHHEGLQWFGEGHWFCADCGQTSESESPTRVICRAQQPAPWNERWDPPRGPGRPPAAGQTYAAPTLAQN